MTILEKAGKETGTAEKRIWPRSKCDIASSFFAMSNQWPCIITDLSERGMGIVATTSLYVGSMIMVSDPRARAKVVWTRGNRAGLRIIN